MDVSNYIRLLEAENKRLEEVNAHLLQDNEALRQGAAENGKSNGETDCAMAPEVGSQGTPRAETQSSLPFSQLLTPHFAGLSQMRPAQRKEIASAVRAFLITKSVKLVEENGEPAVPKYLEKDFIEWFAMYNESENNRVREAEKRTNALKRQPSSSSPEEGAKSSETLLSIGAVPWTDLVRRYHPGAQFGPRHSQFAKGFRSEKKITTTARCSTGQIILGIPPEHEAVFLAAFRDRFLSTGEGEGGSPEPDEQDASNDADYQPRKRKRSNSKSKTATSDAPDSTVNRGPSGVTPAAKSMPWTAELPETALQPVVGALGEAATDNHMQGVESTLKLPTPYAGAQTATCSLSPFVDTTPSLTPPLGSGTQKRAYWTYLVKRWFPGYHESASESEQKRLRELTRTFLISKMGFDGGLYVPESLYPAFKGELDAYRRINLVSTPATA
jgi:hypothetical protein